MEIRAAAVVVLAVGLAGCAGQECVQARDCGGSATCNKGVCEEIAPGNRGQAPGSTARTPPTVGAIPDVSELRTYNDADHGNMVCLYGGTLDGDELAGPEVFIIEMMLQSPAYTYFYFTVPGTDVAFGAYMAGTLDQLPMDLSRLMPGGSPAPVELRAFTLQPSETTPGMADLQAVLVQVGAETSRHEFQVRLKVLPGSPTDEAMIFSPTAGWPGSDPAALSCQPPC